MEGLSVGQLYGEFNEEKEWVDGTLSKAIRDMRDSSEETWLVVRCGETGATSDIFENMNTLLDDNKKLCLVSGEIIAFPSPRKIIFIAKDCSQLSPATCSRVSMVWVE